MAGPKDGFRERVAKAADAATRNRKTASVHEFADVLGPKHVRALALITRSDYAELREGLAAWRKRLELAREIERVFVIAERLEALVELAGGPFADADLADAEEEPTP
jgi:hypothetical protein